MKLNDQDDDDDGMHKSSKLNIECIRCGFDMVDINECHLKCFRCGAELTCSDKGNYWWIYWGPFVEGSLLFKFILIIILQYQSNKKEEICCIHNK